MTRYRLVLVALALTTACSSPPPPKTQAMDEPKVADDLPTWCSGDKKPCVPARDFAQRLCHGQFPGAALFLFQKQSPWQRRWVNAKAGLPAKNAEGGPAGGALEHGEELLVMAVDEPVESQGAESSKKAKKAKKPDPDVLVLRWDGSCATLKASEAVTYLPGNPKHPAVDWAKLDLSVQRSLLRDFEIRRGAEAQQKACTDKSSPDCQKAELALSNTLVNRIRGGVKLSMPEQRP